MIVGTRGSQLALVQTKQVCADLSRITGESIDIEIIKTKGDKITTSQLYNMDSKGLFTKELDIALLDEEVDFTVHSFKDLPTELDEDLEVIAVPKRESPNDVFSASLLRYSPTFQYILISSSFTFLNALFLESSIILIRFTANPTSLFIKTTLS